MKNQVTIFFPTYPLLTPKSAHTSERVKGLWQDFVQSLCQTKNNSIDRMIKIKEMVTKFS